MTEGGADAMRQGTSRHSLAIWCLGLSLFSVVLVQSGDARPTGSAEQPKILRVVVFKDSGAIEPALMGGYDAFQAFNATQLSLVTHLDEGKGAGRLIVPYGAARLPRISRDYRTFAFQIRPGVRFSDGKVVTARNFKEGIERVLNPQMQSPFAFQFEDVVVGARAFTAGRAAHVSGVEIRNG